MSYIHEKTHRDMAEAIPELANLVVEVARRGGQALGPTEEAIVFRSLGLSKAAIMQLERAGALPYERKGDEHAPLG